MRLLTVLLLSLFLSGCIGLMDTGFSMIEEGLNPEKSDGTNSNEVQNFQPLLEDGWDLYIYDGKVVLIKDSPSGGLNILDVFNVLNEE